MPLALPEEILTPRLALIPITPVALHAEQSGQLLAPLIHAEVPGNWPPVDWEPHVFTLLLDQYARNPHQIAWHRYVALLHANGARTLIGCIGAFHRQGIPAECEIGYTILPPNERLGFATEATLALIALIRQDPAITSIVAQTQSNLIASIRVMQKCGLTPDGAGEEPGTIRYRLALSATHPTQTPP